MCSLALLCYSIGCNEHGGLRWQPHTSGRKLPPITIIIGVGHVCTRDLLCDVCIYMSVCARVFILGCTSTRVSYCPPPSRRLWGCGSLTSAQMSWRGLKDTRQLTIMHSFNFHAVLVGGVFAWVFFLADQKKKKINVGMDL